MADVVVEEGWGDDSSMADTETAQASETPPDAPETDADGTGEGDGGADAAADSGGAGDEADEVESAGSEPEPKAKAAPKEEPKPDEDESKAEPKKPLSKEELAKTIAEIEDRDDLPEDTKREFIALTKRRQQLRQMREEALTAHEPVIRQAQQERDFYKQQVTEQQALIGQAEKLVKALREDPRQLLQANGWDLLALANLESDGKVPESVAARLAKDREAEQQAQRQREAEALKQRDQELANLRIQTARMQILQHAGPLANEEMSASPESYQRVALMEPAKRDAQLAEIVLDHMIRTGTELDISDALGKLEVRLSEFISDRELKARQARPEQKKPEKKPEPKLPTPRAVERRPQVDEWADTGSDEADYFRQLAAKHF